MNDVYGKYSGVVSLDSAKIDQLIALGKDIEEDVLGQLILIHQESSQSMLAEMQACVEKNNKIDLKKCAHKFKSSCANLGLMRLYKICSDLEDGLAKNESMAQPLLKEFVDSIKFETDQTNLKLVSFKKAA